MNAIKTGSRIIGMQSTKKKTSLTMTPNERCWRISSIGVSRSVNGWCPNHRIHAKMQRRLISQRTDALSQGRRRLRRIQQVEGTITITPNQEV
jgi:hypothetical protein